MLASRSSVYDNEFYLSATYPPPLDTDTMSLTASQRASMTIMHVFIQCPRLVCLIRTAILNVQDSKALASAMSLIESLIQLDLAKHVAGLLETAITTIAVPTSPDMSDIMPDSLGCDTVQNMILCTRYWMLQNMLCGMADALHRHFPAEAKLSLIPSPEQIQELDVDSALNLAKTLPWAESISHNLPLVPLRLHTPLQVSIGPWHRTIRRVTFFLTNLNDQFDTEQETVLRAELARAVRMKKWLIERCDEIHKQWTVSVVEEEPLLQALDSMAGEAIPDWLPVRVRFEAEDGEMVIKLEYENKTGSYSEQFDISEKPRKKAPSPAEAGQQWQRENLSVQELPFRTSSSQSPLPSPGSTENRHMKSTNLLDFSKLRPADFIHSTGRNLCSTSGWWPTTSNTSTMLLDSTRRTPAFSKTLPEDMHNSSSLPFAKRGNSPDLCVELVATSSK